MFLPALSNTVSTRDWVYSACLWAMVLSLVLQSLPLVRRRRQLTARTGPLFLTAVIAMIFAFLNDDNERISLPCTVLAVMLILVNDWLPVVMRRKP